MFDTEYGIRSIETRQFTFDELIDLLKRNDLDVVEGTVAAVTTINDRDDNSVQTVTFCKRLVV